MSNVEPPQGESGNRPGTGGMPQYPAAPQVPPSGRSGASQVPRPPSVQNAVRLMWVGAAITVISMILGFVTLGSLKSQIRDQLEAGGQDVTQNMVDAGYAFAIGSMIVGGVLGALLWLWMAWKNGQGRRWARIVATVFAAINLIGTISNIASKNATAASWIVQLIGLIVGIVVVILLWRKESSAYFNANRYPIG